MVIKAIRIMICLPKSKKDSSDAETEKPDISEVMKKYQEAHEITAQKLREDTDWRDMTDEEWDKMLEGMDQYIDAFKERLKLQEELQEEAAKKPRQRLILP